MEDTDFDDDIDLEPEPDVVYELRTAAYCGMSTPHDEFEDLADAVAAAQARIKRLKERHGVEVDEIGENTWEINEPEDCNMVPDFCGILKIVRIEKPARRW